MKDLNIPDSYKKLPARYVTEQELNQLPEYSCSLPTGTTIGKTWKMNIRAFVREYAGLPPVWMICQYTEHPDPNMVGIKYMQARLKGDRIKALTATV